MIKIERVRTFLLNYPQFFKPCNGMTEETIWFKIKDSLFYFGCHKNYVITYYKEIPLKDSDTNPYKTFDELLLGVSSEIQELLLFNLDLFPMTLYDFNLFCLSYPNYFQPDSKYWFKIIGTNFFIGFNYIDFSCSKSKICFYQVRYPKHLIGTLEEIQGTYVLFEDIVMKLPIDLQEMLLFNLNLFI